MTTRVLLVDDHELVRDGLRTLFAQDEEFEVVGEAGDARTAVELASACRPDIVVMDVSLPDLSGIEATRQVLAQAPWPPSVGARESYESKRRPSHRLSTADPRGAVHRRAPSGLARRNDGATCQPKRPTAQDAVRSVDW